MGCCQFMFPITSVSSAAFRQSTSWTFVSDPFLSFQADASVYSGDFSSISHLIWFSQISDWASQWIKSWALPI